MGIEFNTEDMLDAYLFENSQLLENLQEIVLEQKDEDYFDEDSINEIFRTMHTIKGSSAIMMYDDITSIDIRDYLAWRKQTKNLSSTTVANMRMYLMSLTEDTVLVSL